MDRNDYYWLAGIVGIFALFFLVPPDAAWLTGGVLGGVALLSEYAKQHVLTCLVPAFFIAGAITVFIKKEAVMRYLGPQAKKWVSYSVASVSGGILAVCSCTVLPIFAGIRKRGAGLGPAITFLFSGPAINIAAIFLTISVLGYKIGIARIVLAIVLSILVGITMHLIFREKSEGKELVFGASQAANASKAWTVSFFGFMVAILVVNGLQMNSVLKWTLMIGFAVVVALIAKLHFERETRNDWLSETWTFTKQLMPLLFIGVFVAGFLMFILPQDLIVRLVGQNTVSANVIASLFGAFMYFSTLTEIPILQALLANGMHSGPALALLIAGPSLSLPNMLVVRSVIGTKKTAVYVGLVVLYATIGGLLFGAVA